MDLDRSPITRRRALGILGAGAAAAVLAPVYRGIAPIGPRKTHPGSSDETVSARLQALLDELLARPEVHEALVVVESGDGSWRWTGAGDTHSAGQTSLREDTPVFLASITKLYTAALVLRLVERGRLSLDEPVTAYLPSELVRGLHRRDGVDRTASITLHHLLGHTSGLADYFTDRPRGGRSLSERLAAEGDMAWTLNELAERVRTELVPHFPPQDVGASRQKVRYSDTNYQLLGAVVEAVEGEPLHAVYERELFRPLGLTRTYLYPHRRVGSTDEPAAIRVGETRRELPLALGSFGADGGMVATLGDALAFLRALVRGAVFDAPATFPLMQRRWNRFGLPLDPVSLQLPSWPLEYGLGLMRFRLPAVLNRVRTMPALLGHTGSTGSWLFYCPEIDLLLAGTVNQAAAGALPYRFVPKLLRALG